MRYRYFFFSSRRRHTRCSRDWSSDVCSSDLVVKLINGLLTDAVKRGASDIHIEPFEHEMRVRYRVDGALHEVMKPPIKMRAALTSRIKIMAQLNIAERRVPQDGRIKLKFGAKVIDYRVSTLPVLFGEKIVLRILDKGNLTLDLSKFGFEPKAERSEEHTSELQSRLHLVCRLLLEKKKKNVEK